MERRFRRLCATTSCRILKQKHIKTSNKLKLTLLLILIAFCAHAQEKSNEVKQPNAHRGVHVELGMVPSFGSITDNVASVYEVIFSGMGLQLEMKAGASIKKNMAVSFDILSKAIRNPKAKVDGSEIVNNDVLYVGEVNYRAGVTIYSLQSNLFCSASAGVGRFVIEDSLSKRWSQLGYSGQMEIGRHFPISKHFGISGGVAGGFTGVDHRIDKRLKYYEHIVSNRISIVVRAVFN